MRPIQEIEDEEQATHMFNELQFREENDKDNDNDKDNS